MSEPIEPGKAMPTYSGFLTLRMNEIWNLWRENDCQGALVLGLRLAETFIPVKIKKPMQKDVDIITKDLSYAYKVKGVDFFTTHLVRNRAAERVARCYITSFLSKLSDALDEWGYYEMPSRRLKSSDFKELEKNES